MISRVKDALPGNKQFVQVTLQSLTEDGLRLVTVVPMRRSDAEELLAQLEYHPHEIGDNDE